MKKRTVKRRKPALISQHRHTGKRLPHEYTSYPLLIFILLFLGVFMAGLSIKASADDVDVSATVYAPPPTVPATIVTPTDGTHFTEVPIIVNGTCEAGDMIKLYRNNNFSGAVLCAADNTFQIQTDLFEGANDLHARVFNVINTEGPQSPIVRVYYDPPAAPIATATSSNPAIPQLTLTAENLYKGYFTGDSVVWEIGIVGGVPPYALSVNWGDGDTSTISRKDPGVFSLKHIYKKPGGYKSSYTIRISLSDSVGNSTFLQLMIIVNDKKAVFATPGAASSSGPTWPFQFQLFWPAYAVTFLMAISFWLGQRRQLLRLRPRLRAHR